MFITGVLLHYITISLYYTTIVTTTVVIIITITSTVTIAIVLYHYSTRLLYNKITILLYKYIGI